MANKRFDINEIIAPLLSALVDLPLMNGNIAEFQNMVWKGDLDGFNDEVREILITLAYDLDFFEPNPDWRVSYLSYFDIERAVELILERFELLRKSGIAIPDIEVDLSKKAIDVDDLVEFLIKALKRRDSLVDCIARFHYNVWRDNVDYKNSEIKIKIKIISDNLIPKIAETKDTGRITTDEAIGIIRYGLERLREAGYLSLRIDLI